jgi:hypothetical protein
MGNVTHVGQHMEGTGEKNAPFAFRLLPFLKNTTNSHPGLFAHSFGLAGKKKTALAADLFIL